MSNQQAPHQYSSSQQFHLHNSQPRQNKSISSHQLQLIASNQPQSKKLGPYTLLEFIGKGANGCVYKGINMLGQTVAIKQVALQNIKESQQKQILTEINLLKRLNHPNIVDYIGCLKSEHHLNIILEFVESGSLAQIIKKCGPFPESLVAIYIKQVLTGLQYLHGQGVIHRDIKGANILITKNGIVKLADFGVATCIQTNTNNSNNLENKSNDETMDQNDYSIVGTPC